MRSSSQLKSKIIAVIPEGTRVTLVSEKGKEITISGVKGKWSRVKWKGKTGWVFGGYLAEISSDKSGKSSGFGGADPFDFTCANECRGNSRKGCGDIEKYYRSYISASKNINQHNQSEAYSLMQAARKLNELCPDAFSNIEKKDYSGLIGSWVDIRAGESTARVMIFKPKGVYEEYLFYNKEEKLKGGRPPQSTVFTAYGTCNVSCDVLVIRITGTSANTKPSNKSFHFVKFEKDEMILLNTAGGKRTTWKKAK
jgi:hypothetical protein